MQHKNVETPLNFKLNKKYFGHTQVQYNATLQPIPGYF